MSVAIDIPDNMSVEFYEVNSDPLSVPHGEARSVSLIFLLDESASMRSKGDSVLSYLINSSTNKRRIKATVECLLSSLVPEVEPLFDNIILSHVPTLTDGRLDPKNETYYDAMGYVLENYASTNNVILVIFTDGAENSSKKWDKTRVMSSISAYREAPRNWTTIFLSDDLFLSQQASSSGMAHNPLSRSVNVPVNYNGNELPELMRSLSIGVANYSLD